MAATIAEAIGYDNSREKYTHRLGSVAAEVTAATWRTFARAYVSRDGSGYVRVTRGGLVIHEFEFGPE